MAFSNSLGEILFSDGWTLGGLGGFLTPAEEAELVSYTGFDDLQERVEACVELLFEAGAISHREYVGALEDALLPTNDFAESSLQPAPRQEVVLQNGKKIELGEKTNGWYRPTI